MVDPATEGSDFAEIGSVLSTTLFHKRNTNFGTSWYRLVDAHRGMTQHQLTITAPVPISGEYKVLIIPDTAEFNMIEAVDTGRTIKFTNSKSASMVFPAVLRGIRLDVVTPFTLGTVVTGVLSSTTGN